MRIIPRVKRSPTTNINEACPNNAGIYPGSVIALLIVIKTKTEMVEILLSSAELPQEKVQLERTLHFLVGWVLKEHPGGNQNEGLKNMKSFVFNLQK